MMYFTFIFLSWSPGIPRILRRCLALEREYCVNFEPYINDELSELVKTYGYRIEVPANTYYIKPGQKLTEITYIASGSTSHSMFGLTGQEKISYILSAGWFLTESLFANKKMFSIAERYTVLSEFWVFQEKVDMKVSAFSFTTSLLVFGYL